MPEITATTPLAHALDLYLDTVRDRSESLHTARAYRQATQAFLRALEKSKRPQTNPPAGATGEARALADADTPVGELSRAWFECFLAYLQRKEKNKPVFAAATESLYLTALLGFVQDFLYPVLERKVQDDIRLLIKNRRRKIHISQPPFPKADIEKILAAVQAGTAGPFAGETEQRQHLQQLRAWRDCTLLLFLADSGLRVFEACGLRRGEVDYQEGQITVTGKGGKKAQVRLSKRALRALKTYLQIRARQDGQQGRKLESLPLFARHDRGSQNKTLPLTTRSAERLVDHWVKTVCGEDQVGTITPHTFRHYFVTIVIRARGGDFQVAQKLARHSSIATTQRYAHISDTELDQAYEEIFNE